MFFDDYPRFFETSTVWSESDRLNLRYEAIFAANKDVFDGARVLDLASHDGRWSFAALRTGAAHVTGIESRQEAVENATANLSHYGADPDTYRFIRGDIFDVLRSEEFDVDVVLCLGFMYHTYRHTELLHRIRRIDPTYFIVDSTVVPHQEQPFVKLYEDRPQKPGEATLDEFAHGTATLVGRPSVPALRMMLRAYDFGVEHTYDWCALIDEHPDASRVGDYADGKRVTMRCRTGVSHSFVPERDGVLAGAVPSLPANATARITTGNGQDVADETPSTRWREVVNRGLARTTGYELRRSTQ